MKCCNASAKWKGTNRFVFCELPKGHKGKHKAIGISWDGKEDSETII